MDQIMYDAAVALELVLLVGGVLVIAYVAWLELWV